MIPIIQTHVAVTSTMPIFQAKILQNEPHKPHNYIMPVSHNAHIHTTSRDKLDPFVVTQLMRDAILVQVLVAPELGQMPLP